TATDWRRVLGQVRTRAKNRLGSKLQLALRKYVEAHHQQLPTEPGQLAEYFEAAPDPAIFERFELNETGRADRLSRRATVIQEKRSTAIDPDYDNLLVVGPGWVGVKSVNTFGPSDASGELEAAMDTALKAYRAANANADPAGPEELAPYFKDPAVAASFVQQALRVTSGNRLFSEPNAIGHAVNLYRFANHGESPSSPEKLAPYFQDTADAARYLAAQGKMPRP
ncbi:MAG: hypothetical protein NTV51_11280, partial [Verrucomicrobia bacterium]|nr:hypothetical protein [Verrucomicrobiota bacterium]